MKAVARAVVPEGCVGPQRTELGDGGGDCGPVRPERLCKHKLLVNR